MSAPASSSFPFFRTILLQKLTECEVLAYVGRIHNLKDLNDQCRYYIIERDSEDDLNFKDEPHNYAQVPLKIARHPILKVTCKHFALPLEPF